MKVVLAVGGLIVFFRGVRIEIKTAKPGAIRREGLVGYVQLRGWMWVEVWGRNNSTHTK